MFNRDRNIKKAFYPQRLETYNAKKNPYSIAKAEGEIRLISCDIAQRAGKANDLAITSCIRLLPTYKGYFRELLYMESYSGKDSITQGLRMKQIYYDFEADVLVLDVANAGIAAYDQLGIVTKDVERGIEYPPMTILPHESLKDVYDELRGRTLGLNAIECIYPISATGKLNSDIAVSMRDKLQKRMWGFLTDEANAEDYLTKSLYAKEFLSQSDPTSSSWFLAPYVQTSLLVNECINLSMVMSIGNIKLVENPGGRKDRYTSVSYGNYYASLLDQDLIREGDNEDDYDIIASLIQTT